MSVWVGVGSILTPQSHIKPGSSVRQLLKKMRLEAICSAFGWQNPLWSEPSEAQGLTTSMGNGRYSILLSLAWAIEDLDGEAAQHIPELIRIVEETRRSPSEHQYAELRDTCKIFPHLLDRNIYCSFYLPIDFPHPKHITLDIPGEDDLSRRSISVASSVRLCQELQLLRPLLDRIVEVRGDNAYVPSYKNYAWSSVHNACLTLMDACSDSSRLNLPIVIAW